MPYNTNVIPPNEEPTGTTQLPFSRIKKIIAADQDINIMSNAGAFLITVATEMFIQHLAQQAHSVVRSERKPRRNIQYRDLATAVSNHDNLEFLVDIVPNTVPFKRIKDKKVSLASLSAPKLQGQSVDDDIIDAKEPKVQKILDVLPPLSNEKHFTIPTTSINDSEKEKENVVDKEVTQIPVRSFSRSLDCDEN